MLTVDHGQPFSRGEQKPDSVHSKNVYVNVP